MRPPRAVQPVRADLPAARFIGGWQLDASNATWPFIELAATTETLTLRARFGLARICRTQMVTRDEVADIRIASGLFLYGMGIEIHTRDRFRTCTFWTLSAGQVLVALRQFGYPVTFPPRCPPVPKTP